MADKVKPVPEGFHTATPYLIVKDATAAIEFYKNAFGAVELERIAGPDGKIGHAEIRIGDSPFMMTDEHPDFPDYQSPLARGGSSLHIYLYVEDADEVFNQAIAAGAKQLTPVQDQFYGDRNGGITDPFGHVWYVATRIENLSPEEIMERAKAWAAQKSQA
jgi:PhnB protein